MAREVGTEGKLGGQAQVPGVGGTWKDLTDNVNFMASNLTAQVRNMFEAGDGRRARRSRAPIRGGREEKDPAELETALDTAKVDQAERVRRRVTRVAPRGRRLRTPRRTNCADAQRWRRAGKISPTT